MLGLRKIQCNYKYLWIVSCHPHNSQKGNIILGFINTYNTSTYSKVLVQSMVVIVVGYFSSSMLAGRWFEPPLVKHPSLHL